MARQSKAPGKGKARGNRGANPTKYAMKAQARVSTRSSQAAGKDPGRGKGR